MPIILAVLAFQILLGWHAARTGRLQPWLWIIIVFPGVGGLLYVATQILPDWLGSRQGQRAFTTVSDRVAPERHYKALREALDMAPTVENRVRLAEECHRLGRYAEAIQLFDGSLSGIHSDDLRLLGGLARAHFAAGDAARALDAINRLRAAAPDHYDPDLHLVFARALEAAGETDAALDEYAGLADSFPGEEARCRYACLLRSVGREMEAQMQFETIVQHGRHRRGEHRAAQRPWEEIAKRELL